ncbi:MAG: ATP-dependent Clp protease proteolytic subunit [Flavobacteriales bacterium]
MSSEKKTVYITFVGGIDKPLVNKFITFCTNAVNEHKPDELYFMIASPGGDVDSGFVLSNYLQALQGGMQVTMHNIGNIDSIANVIFLSGEKRVASPNASFHFHGISMNVNGAMNRTALKETLSRCEGMENRIIKTVSTRSKLSTETLEGLFSQGEGKDVAFALEHGIIDEIKEPSLPSGAVHLVMNFQ